MTRAQEPRNMGRPGSIYKTEGDGERQRWTVRSTARPPLSLGH